MRDDLPCLQGSRGRYPYNRGKHLIAALELWAYGDETGIQDGAQFCLLVGYIGSPRQWSSFKRAWNSLLHAYEVTEFHSIDFFQGARRWKSEKNPYHGWDAAKRRTFLDGLLEIILSTHIVPIGWAVKTEAFYALREDERRYFTGAYLTHRIRAWRKSVQEPFQTEIIRKFSSSGAKSRPYTVAFNRFIDNALEVADPHTDIHIVCDTQNVNEAWSIKNFHETWKKRRGRDGNTFDGKELVSLTYTDSARESALQAADLYAYIWGRHSNGSPTPDIKHAIKRMASEKNYLFVADEDYFQRRLGQLRGGGQHGFGDAVAGVKDGAIELTFRKGPTS